MSDAINNLILDLKTQGMRSAVGDLKKFRNELMHMQKGQKATFTAIKRTNLGMEKMSVNFQRTNKGIKTLSGNISTTTSNMRRFKMEWLSVMFFSMQMQRVLKRILSSSIKTFMQIAGETDRANQSMASFGAQINFIRFTLGRAIAEAFEPFLPTFTEFVEKLADFIEENPEKVVWGLVGAFLAFFGLFTAAQIALVTTGLAQIASSITAVGAKALALSGLKAISIGLAIYFTYEGFKLIGEGFTEDDWKKVALGILGLGGAGALLGFVIGGIAGAGIGLLVGISVGLLFSFYKAKTKTGKTPKEAITEILLGKDTGGLLSGTKIGIGGFGIDIFEITSNILSKWREMSKGVQEQNEHMFGAEKKSFPMVWALKQVEIEWKTMSDIAILNIDRIITRINAIPREVVTVHRIVTVEERRSDNLRRWI